jgi:hypothetical protein
MHGKKLYTDTMFAKICSLLSNTCAKVWTDGLGYSLFCLLKRKREQASRNIYKMVHDLKAIPEVIVSDGLGEQTGVKWKDEFNLS